MVLGHHSGRGVPIIGVQLGYLDRADQRRSGRADTPAENLDLAEPHDRIGSVDRRNPTGEQTVQTGIDHIDCGGRLRQ